MLLMLGGFPGTLPMPWVLTSPAEGDSAQMVCRRFVEKLESAREHCFSLLGLTLISFSHKNVKVKRFVSLLCRSVPKSI